MPVKKVIAKKPKFIKKHATPIFRWSAVIGLIGVLAQSYFNHSSNVGNSAIQIENQQKIIDGLRDIKSQLKDYKSDGITEAKEIMDRLNDLTDYVHDTHHK